MKEMSELAAEKLSLFQLLKKFYKLEIPLIQRDYAHGRIEKENESYETTELENVQLIREGLIEAMFNAVACNKMLLLNFIYGKSISRDGKLHFIPIDGQQRLTTMYLFHWYIFKKTDFTDGLSELRKFSYATRATSKSFCEYLCDNSYSFDFSQSIKTQIHNFTWFSGNYGNDPTVQSMVTVLSAIQDKINSYPDFETLKERLISEDLCPIKFLWLDMKNIGNEDDLYIKMNARGKQLSDFEVFKAGFETSELLSNVIESRDITAKVDFVSKFNNEYSDLMYRYLGKKADDALMVLLKVVLRNNYLVLASKNGISQQTYRDDYKAISSMNGKMFFQFAEEEDKLKYYVNKTPLYDYKSSHRDSIRMVDNILNKLISHQSIEIERPSPYIVDYGSDAFILIEYLDPSFKTSMENDLVQYCMYSFIFKFDLPNNINERLAYFAWKRFVYNISKNVDIRTYETLVETMRIMQDVLDSIDSFQESSILSAIRDVKNNPALVGKRFLRPQFIEESLKASLISENPDWKSPILEVESYFTKGDIGFILDFSKEETSEYSIEKFNYYFNKITKLIDKDKVLLQQELIIPFEKALLCQPDNTRSQMGHLIKLENSNAYAFCIKGFNKLLGNDNDNEEQCAKWQIFKNLLDQIDNNNIAQSLSAVISSNSLRLSGWKKTFVDEDIFDIALDNNPDKKLKFSNCIYIAKDKTVLLLTKNSERSRSGELNTVLLYTSLKQKYDSIRMQLEATGEIIDSDGTPRRYIEYSTYMIGYSTIDNCYYYWSKSDKSLHPLNNKDDVIAFIEGL